MLVGTTGLVEEGGLPAVGVTEEGNAQGGKLSGLDVSQLHAVEAVQLGIWKQLLWGIEGISLLLKRLKKTHLNALCIAVSERDIIV